MLVQECISSEACVVQLHVQSVIFTQAVMRGRHPRSYPVQSALWSYVYVAMTGYVQRISQTLIVANMTDGTAYCVFLCHSRDGEKVIKAVRCKKSALQLLGTEPGCSLCTHFFKTQHNHMHY